MNDHQDSENFSYNRSWEEIESLLHTAEQEQNRHFIVMQRGNKKDRINHMRKYKGLQGVINALRWVLGDLKVNQNKVLGRNKE